MTQISRPFQIALLALVLFAAVWFVALRGQSASSGGSGSPPSSQAAKGGTPSPAAQAQSAAAPTPVYHGAAPGVEGLTRAIAKAHEAVASSQQQAKQVEGESAQSGPSSATGAPAPGTASQPGAAAGARTGTARTGAPAASVKLRPSMQGTVEAELKRGKVVTILFWNPKSSVDRTVHGELNAAGSALGGKVAVHDALAAQVGSFGSITRTVQVDVTPTILIVNPRGQTSTITGLTDAFAIEQAIDEARRP
ncbi:MAG: hypothetical protein ACLQMH_15310 [Solirubrobacteraceae bacterium]